MLSIILNEIRSNLRNKTTIFLSFLFPSLCVFFLGTFLEKVETSDAAVGELSIAYCMENASEHHAVAFGNFINSLVDKDVLTAEKVTAEQIREYKFKFPGGNLNSSKFPRENFDSGNFDSEKYSALIELDGSEFTIYYGNDAIKNRTVKAMLEGYNQIYAVYEAAASANPSAMSSIEISNERFVSNNSFGKTRTMMDYYAVTMAVVITFFGAVSLGACTYADEYANHTIERLNASLVSPSAVFFGKIIGTLPVVFIQTISVMLSSTLLFGAHYCDTFGGNLLLFVLFICASLSAVSVGVLFNLFFPKVPALTIFMSVLWLAMFLSGTFTPDIYISGLTECMPMYQIQRAAFDLTVFGKNERIVRVVLISLVVFAVALFGGWLKAKMSSAANKCPH